SGLDEDAILAQAEAIKAAEAAQKALNTAYDSQLEKFKEQIALTGEATEFEKIRYSIASGALAGINEQRQLELETLAAQIDAINEAARAEQARADKMNEVSANLMSVQSALMDQETAYAVAADERALALREAYEAGLIGEE